MLPAIFPCTQLNTLVLTSSSQAGHENHQTIKLYPKYYLHLNAKNFQAIDYTLIIPEGQATDVEFQTLI
jgi:hypothetical protein